MAVSQAAVAVAVALAGMKSACNEWKEIMYSVCSLLSFLSQPTQQCQSGQSGGEIASASFACKGIQLQDFLLISFLSYDSASEIRL